MSRVFISYSHSDKEFARRLADDLRRLGHVVWIDEGEIRVGDSIIEKIRDGIDAVDFVVAVISKYSAASEWVKKELDLASNREIKDKDMVVLPALLDDVPLPGFLEGKLFADFRSEQNYQQALAEIVRPLESAPPLPTEPAAGHDAMKKELEELKALVSTHRRDFKRIRQLLKRERSSHSQKFIEDENRHHPEYTAINEAYAFEIAGLTVTIGYLLHAIRKANIKGMHALDVLLTDEKKWDRVDLMVSAYNDYLNLMH